jgi:hypothetical protein
MREVNGQTIKATVCFHTNHSAADGCGVSQHIEVNWTADSLGLVEIRDCNGEKSLLESPYVIVL